MVLLIEMAPRMGGAQSALKSEVTGVLQAERFDETVGFHDEARKQQTSRSGKAAMTRPVRCCAYEVGGWRRNVSYVTTLRHGTSRRRSCRSPSAASSAASWRPPFRSGPCKHETRSALRRVDAMPGGKMPRKTRQGNATGKPTRKTAFTAAIGWLPWPFDGVLRSVRTLS